MCLLCLWPVRRSRALLVPFYRRFTVTEQTIIAFGIELYIRFIYFIRPSLNETALQLLLMFHFELYYGTERQIECLESI